MQQSQTEWQSVADAAANTPNPLYASTADYAHPDGKSSRLTLCGFIRSHRSCMATGIAVLLSLVAVGLAPLTFINKEEISQLSTDFNSLKHDQYDMHQLSTTIDALKRDQDNISTTVKDLKRDQDYIRQLSTTVDALKSDLNKERNRTNALEQSLREIAPCPDGYTKWRRLCYKAFNTEKTFSGAAEACHDDGGTLAIPRDADTNAFLISLYNSLSDNRAFLFGLHDWREEGRFEWVDGSALGTYNSWGPDQPDNYDGIEDCVHFDARPGPQEDTWNDTPCYKAYLFICQTAPGGRRNSPEHNAAALRPAAVKLTSNMYVKFGITSSNELNMAPGYLDDVT
uniref:C-type lectin domain-containing protein n=1 Tax=Branchiostoma floridae TaxID=7739 RepID=C3XVA6_BRAFL|eukprot:XP_002612023.1 hypothetical protein BRAFLDRAFT_86994 [Branchiostoma floridae]